MNDSPSTDTQISIFRAPITKYELREHVVVVSLVLARQLHFVFARPGKTGHEEAQAMLLGLSSTDGINDPDVVPGSGSLALNFSHLADTALGLAMAEAYDFAYHGALLGNGSNMNSESSLSWVSRVLADLQRSHFAQEWHEHSACLDAITALLNVCETAEARLILEGIQRDDTFMGWHSNERFDGLTFRQMAFLSGMSEASLRTLANPKRSNGLRTVSNGRHTYVERVVAKDWLVSKGRYVPLTNTDLSGANLDLSNETITSHDELQDRLDARVHFLAGTDEGPTVEAALASIREDLMGVRPNDNTRYLNLTDEDWADSALLRKVAKALGLPGELLCLKAAHLNAAHQAELLKSRFEEAARRSKKQN